MTVHFLHISDTHLGTHPEFELAPGVRPYQRTEALIDWIVDWVESQRGPLDFVVHTGDLVHRGHLPPGDGASTRSAMELMQRIPGPLHFAVGNHDHRRALMQCLGVPPGNSVSDADLSVSASQRTATANLGDRWAYEFLLQGERFVILDARGPLEIDPRGSLCQDQMAWVDHLLSDTDEPVTFFLHYPPVALDCAWIDETMCILNGDAFHQMLRPRASRVRGVFYGHIHRPTSALRDGILYVSSGSASMHFPNAPRDTAATVEGDPIAMANYVCIDDRGTLVKQQWVTFAPSISSLSQGSMS